MDVFGLGIKVKEEGAATVEASLKKLGATIGKTVLTVGAITATIKKFVEASSEAQFAAANLNSALASVADTVGVTAEALNEQAGALQKVSTYGDDAITKMQTLLLTFDNIRGEVFMRSIPAIVDLAARLQVDLTSAAMMVGKALQDPVTGLMALNRSTKIFTEAEKDMVTQLVNTGDLLQAQEFILGRVESRFNGAAAAARNTLGGALQALNESWGDLFEVSQESSQGIIDVINNIALSLPKIRDAANIGFLTLDVWLGETVKKFYQLDLALAKVDLGFAKLVKWKTFGLVGGTYEKEQQARIDNAMSVLKGIDQVIEERLVKLNQGLVSTGTSAVKGGGAPLPRVLKEGGKEDKGGASAVEKDTFDLYKTALESALKAFEAQQSELAKRKPLQILPDDFLDTVRADLEETATALGTIGANTMLPVGAVIGAGLSEGIASGIEGGVRSGLEGALASGRIGDAFKAMGQSIIQSMARAMVDVALKAINFSKMLASITKFMAGHPILALAAATALLAMARASGGGAGTGSMSAIGGPGGLTYSAAGAMGSMAPTQLIFGATSATTAAGMTPRQSMNVTVIGPNDPSAQRAIQELMAKADSRGRIG